MGSAAIQGELWGARARDWAELGEPTTRPLFERVLAELGVGPGARLLDMGCGAGLAALTAAQLGAEVAGIDAAAPLIDIARERLPNSRFEVGDLETTPFPSDHFDFVTGFNSLQFAADIVAALAEARRVTKTGGKFALALWGRPSDCESSVTMGAVAKLLPPPAPGGRPGYDLSDQGVVAGLLRQAGFAPTGAGEVDCVFGFPDLATAVRGMSSAGMCVLAARHSGDDAVRQAIVDTLAPFRQPDGGYRQRNRFRYFTATA